MNNVTTQSIPHTEHFIINIASVVTFNTLMYWPIKEYVFACFSCLAYIWIFFCHSASNFTNFMPSVSQIRYVAHHPLASSMVGKLLGQYMLA